MFLDESGFAHDTPQNPGTPSKELGGADDWGEKGCTNGIGALFAGALLTVSLFGTTVHTMVFSAWVIQDLIPKMPEKSVVTMDNATFHKGADMVKSLESAGHMLLYLPPYLPYLNPIEKKMGTRKVSKTENEWIC